MTAATSHCRNGQRIVWDKFQLIELYKYIAPRIGTASLVSTVIAAMREKIPAAEFRNITTTVAAQVWKKAQLAAGTNVALPIAVPAAITKLPSVAPRVIILTNKITGTAQVFQTDEYTLAQY